LGTAAPGQLRPVGVAAEFPGSSHSHQHTETGVAGWMRGGGSKGGEALVDVVLSCELTKISGFHKPSKVNEAAFLADV